MTKGSFLPFGNVSYGIIAKSRFRVDKVGHILQSPNASDVICTNTEECNGNCRENWAKFERVVATKFGLI